MFHTGCFCIYLDKMKMLTQQVALMLHIPQWNKITSIYVEGDHNLAKFNSYGFMDKLRVLEGFKHKFGNARKTLQDYKEMILEDSHVAKSGYHFIFHEWHYEILSEEFSSASTEESYHIKAHGSTVAEDHSITHIDPLCFKLVLDDLSILYL